MTPRTILGMTLYNNARHLREATDSILGQTDRDFMLLMLDDGSVGTVEGIALEYEERDHRVRYFVIRSAAAWFRRGRKLPRSRGVSTHGPNSLHGSAITTAGRRGGSPG